MKTSESYLPAQDIWGYPVAAKKPPEQGLGHPDANFANPDEACKLANAVPAGKTISASPFDRLNVLLAKDLR